MAIRSVFNLTLASIDSYINGIAISDRKCQEVIDYYKEKLHIKAVADRVELVEAGSPFGGNQQKIVLGKWLAIKPDVPDSGRADERRRCQCKV